MNFFRTILVAILFEILVSSYTAVAETMSATCDEPSGSSLSVRDGRPVFGEGSRISGLQLVYTWDSQTGTATIASNFPEMKGYKPYSRPAKFFRISDRHISFIEPTDMNIWMHSLFLEKKIVILTMQKEDSGVGSGENFWSKCKISGKIP